MLVQRINHIQCLDTAIIKNTSVIKFTSPSAQKTGAFTSKLFGFKKFFYYRKVKNPKNKNRHNISPRE